MVQILKVSAKNPKLFIISVFHKLVCHIKSRLALCCRRLGKFNFSDVRSEIIFFIKLRSENPQILINPSRDNLESLTVFCLASSNVILRFVYKF